MSSCEAFSPGFGVLDALVTGEVDVSATRSSIPFSEETALSSTLAEHIGDLSSCTKWPPDDNRKPWDNKHLCIEYPLLVTECQCYGVLQVRRLEHKFHFETSKGQ